MQKEAHISLTLSCSALALPENAIYIIPYCYI